MDELVRLLKKTRGLVCIECGRCTGICPVSRADHRFSPRSVLVRTIHADIEGIRGKEDIWYCLTCGHCSQICPMDLNYLEFTKLARNIASKIGDEAKCSHGGAFQSLMKIMTNPELKPDKWGWVTGVEINEGSDIGYFVGCLPLFDTLFSDLKMNTINSGLAAIKLLNRSGIKPALIKDERCCGHDLLWMGDIENFKKLAEHNVEVIEAQGLKKVVFSCPEGYRTFKIDYPQLLGRLPFEVVHIFEVLKEGNLKFPGRELGITYQDPCRLSRHLGLDQLPRDMIARASGLQLVEMQHSRKQSICCGVASWISCTVYAKKIQLRRLEEARNTGAEMLVTSCPKCQIHFSCTQQELPEAERIAMVDLLTLLTD
ncbi:MAG TPA: (Fe-S)-binding protein [bacterium (Candidatus Stahlbacteria)]|nr:(Fe-S)-binding protein [Candidatus Stahlbacteria bacterium]